MDYYNLKFKALEYTDIGLIADKLRAKNSYLSEYSFTNSYLFREPHKYEVALCNDCTFLRGVTYDGKRYLMPVCPLDIVPLDTLKFLTKETDFFFPIEEEWLKYFPSDYFEYSFLEGDSDYIYTTERLATLAGRKLSKKRNLLKQFYDFYEDYEVKPLSIENHKDGIAVLDKWLEETMQDGNMADYPETKEALEKMDELQLFGEITYVAGKPVGFLLGEELNDETFALHFAKASREYKGIYQHLYNHFAKAILEKYKYINFEQDLGKDTLRQAKSTYYPDMMRVKYRVAKKV